VIELDPKYCDVIVRRWEAFTGRQAKSRVLNHQSAQGPPHTLKCPLMKEPLSIPDLQKVIAVVRKLKPDWRHVGSINTRA